ncbi:hypothetical protein EVAR_62967_1 [Eumeta japonica]|uniref:Uncharacterized protein n=1 Tax=Eumeta variegata TaxID=151549 RepID=A0A4C1ZFJ5_EUMVA|nr:hypothetical protein EVAR_62967_1 [Eumeta japonica]
MEGSGSPELSFSERKLLLHASIPCLNDDHMFQSEDFFQNTLSSEINHRISSSSLTIYSILELKGQNRVWSHITTLGQSNDFTIPRSSTSSVLYLRYLRGLSLRAHIAGDGRPTDEWTSTAVDTSVCEKQNSSIARGLKIKDVNVKNYIEFVYN